MALERERVTEKERRRRRNKRRKKRRRRRRRRINRRRRKKKEEKKKKKKKKKKQKKNKKKRKNNNTKEIISENKKKEEEDKKNREREREKEREGNRDEQIGGGREIERERERERENINIPEVLGHTDLDLKSLDMSNCQNLLRRYSESQKLILSLFIQVCGHHCTQCRVKASSDQSWGCVRPAARGQSPLGQEHMIEESERKIILSLFNFSELSESFPPPKTLQ